MKNNDFAFSEIRAKTLTVKPYPYILFTGDGILEIPNFR